MSAVDPSDLSGLLDLYGSDESLARARADAMGQRARGLQNAGLVLKTLTGDRDPTGGAFTQMGQHELDQAASGIQHGASTRLQEKHLGIQEQQMQNVLRHQQETERHAQALEAIATGRLGISEETARQRGYRYNPNTGQYEQPAGPPRLVAPRAAGSAPASPPADASAVPGGAPVDSPAASGARAGVAGAKVLVQPLAGKMLDKALKELGSDFDPSGGRAGEFGKNQARVNAAGRFLALAESPDGKPVDLNPQQMAEATQSLVSLISSGGQGAQAQIEHMLPKSFTRDAAGIAQYLTSEPHGAGQLAFVQNMIDTAKRERDVAAKGLDAVRSQRGAKHQRVLAGNPAEARRVLQGFGWDLAPDGLPTMGGAKPASDTATVKYQGKVLEIPRARLAEAVKDGAEEVK